LERRKERRERGGQIEGGFEAEKKGEEG